MTASNHTIETCASKKLDVLCQEGNVDLIKLLHLLKCEADLVIQQEPELKSLIEDVFQYATIGQVLAARLSRRLASIEVPKEDIEQWINEAFQSNPNIVQSAAKDLLAIYDRDAACFSPLEPLLYFKGFMALTTYRVSHQFWLEKRRWLALYLQSLSSEIFTVDIHPAARIGCGILMDHATSCVIGETAIVEDNVSILHEVTLGGTGKKGGDRHPIIRSGVLLGAGSKILGRVEVGYNAKVGAGSVVLMNVPPNTTVAGVPAVVVGSATEHNPASEMNQKIDCCGLPLNQ